VVQIPDDVFLSGFDLAEQLVFSLLLQPFSDVFVFLVYVDGFFAKLVDFSGVRYGNYCAVSGGVAVDSDESFWRDGCRLLFFN
jgi:hypothetical protein